MARQERQRKILFESLSRIAGSSPTMTKAFELVSSTAVRGFDCSDVDLVHLHHRIECALSGSAIRIGYRFGQGDRRNLPGQAPFVFAPAARALLPAVGHDRVPITIR